LAVLPVIFKPGPSSNSFFVSDYIARDGHIASGVNHQLAQINTFSLSLVCINLCVSNQISLKSEDLGCQGWGFPCFARYPAIIGLDSIGIRENLKKL